MSKSINTEKIFSISQLISHAAALAEEHKVKKSSLDGISVVKKSSQNKRKLIRAYKDMIQAVDQKWAITSATEWYIDNFHLVMENLREIKFLLPPKYYRSLPKLDGGPWNDYPRIYSITHEFVIHTDGQFDPLLFSDYIKSYQSVMPLTIGEIWSLSVILRLTLLDKLCQLVADITDSQDDRKKGDKLCNEILDSESDIDKYIEKISQSLCDADISPSFSVQLLHRLKFQDSKVAPILRLLDKRFIQKGLTAEQFVIQEHLRESAINISVQNIISSLRLMAAFDWRVFFEEVSLVDGFFRQNPTYCNMDFITRNRYRNELEQLAIWSSKSEVELAKTLIDKTQFLKFDEITSKRQFNTKEFDLGYYLIAAGRSDFEKEIEAKIPINQSITRLFLGKAALLYILSIVSTSMLLLTLLLHLDRATFFMKIAAFFLTTELASATINTLISKLRKPRHLPRLGLSKGIPSKLKTFVVIPTIIKTQEAIEAQVKQLEIHYLSNPDGNIFFALLADWADSDEPMVIEDAKLTTFLKDKIKELNTSYPYSSKNKNRFFALTRKRLWNESEGKWICWERKRGKLHEFNRLLRGDLETTFVGVSPRDFPLDVKYIITLDADTRLPKGVVAKLVGTLAHPLNTARVDNFTNRVIDGYGILQPRITQALPSSREGTLFHTLFSGTLGIDCYSSTASDVYQDLTGEGSYMGKGIYEIDIFEQALKNRIPESRILSHDLIEGNFAHCGFINDVELIETAPSHSEVAINRYHRWTRGDWQLLPWLFGRGGRAISLLGRWKIFDNLRRSLTLPMTLTLLVLAVYAQTENSQIWYFLVTIVLSFYPSYSFFSELFTYRPSAYFRHSILSALINFKQGVAKVALSISFIPHHAMTFSDAILRALFRLMFSKKKLLEWTTSEDSLAKADKTLLSFLYYMRGTLIFTALLTIFIILWRPEQLRYLFIFLLLWFLSPFIAWKVSVLKHNHPSLPLAARDLHYLRNCARKMWRYFETFVTSDENHLPPDNFQEDPTPSIAHRTSPTNMGLYLLSVISAHDFGWIGLTEMVQKLSATLDSMDKLIRYQGHFYNWYDTTTLTPLEPRYVSSVDSGNLAGHLLAIAQSCEEKMKTPLQLSIILFGTQDSFRSIRKNLFPEMTFVIRALAELEALLLISFDEVNDKFKHYDELDKYSAILVDTVDAHCIEEGYQKHTELLSWSKLLRAEILSHKLDLNLVAPWSDNQQQHRNEINQRLNLLANRCRSLFHEMKFGFLYNPSNKFFSIGQNMSRERFDNSYYDLLASEARLLSFVAIAKGDVPFNHWFRLGRQLTGLNFGASLQSWSGSMFEYLMPALVMESPQSSVQENTNRLVVKEQIDYANLKGVPWGISESAYNVRNIHLTYQYSSFGLPSLGIRRGLDADLVIAPYATYLAAMIDPISAVKNLKVLSNIGASGTYGHYEALDFTPERIPPKAKNVIIKSYMSHHIGMSLVSLANVFFNGIFRKRFHAEPIVMATEFLLHERSSLFAIKERQWKNSIEPRKTQFSASATERRYFHGNQKIPQTHLLASELSSIMVTSSGSGHSRYGDISLNRWREDSTLDNWGSFVYLRDLDTKKVWSAGFQPICTIPDKYEVTFTEDRATFLRRDGNVITQLDLFISPDDHAQIRQIKIGNNGYSTKVIEVTFFSELVLNTHANDIAHPAFSNLFVETEYIESICTLVANRRPRSTEEKSWWVGLIISPDEHRFGEIEYESDRVRFLGRGRNASNAKAIFEGLPLSGTVGPVLDPALGLRTKIRVPAGESALINFTIAVATSREKLIALAEKYQDAPNFKRAASLAWTQAQVSLHHLGIEHDEANLYQELANRLIFSNLSLRASPEVLSRNSWGIGNLWAHGISGENPIILIKIAKITELNLVKQILRAHEYWSSKHLKIDLIILDESHSSYHEPLFETLKSVIGDNGIAPISSSYKSKGAIFLFKADNLAIQDCDLLMTSARAILIGQHGSLSEQVERHKHKEQIPLKMIKPHQLLSSKSSLNLATPKLEFFNGLGGFTSDGKEYVICLHNNQQTPAPWINVIANKNFGFHVSENGSGSTWSVNGRENQLTPWSNDSVSDPSGECFYIFDETAQEVWTPTPLPIRIPGATYIITHGQGYSHFKLLNQGIESTLTQFVDGESPVKISKLVLKNKLSRNRQLVVSAYIEWVLGFSRASTAPFIITNADLDTNAVFAQNPWSHEFSNRVAFSTFVGGNDSFTCDRSEFLGRNGMMKLPLALANKKKLNGRFGMGLDPCAVLQRSIYIEAESEVTIYFLLGQAEDREKAQALIDDFSPARIKKSFSSVIKEWDSLLETIQIETPDSSLNYLFNRWLLYQTVSCRMWARVAFYQAGGAWGFRDQLQDSMALVWARPDLAKEQIIRSAGRQFTEGDVQHWWHLPSGRGVRTHFTDDLLWLPFAVSHYLETTQDLALLDEEIAFLKGPLLNLDQEDAYYIPEISSESGSIYEHCARALDYSLSVGVHGLPLIGRGDWNDGMNRVGHEGKGESVWLAWFLMTNLNVFAKIAQGRGEQDRAQCWLTHSSKLKIAAEEAWDGAWYRRAYFDDQTPLGSTLNDACKIDSISQSWAVISGQADPERARQAMASVMQLLVTKKDFGGLVLLLKPPFDQTVLNPGYIKGYIPGVRENGGQYTHAAIWCIIAHALLDNKTEALKLFSIINPINHTSGRAGVLRYKAEPYVMAADVYSQIPHSGRGGWTWYTGAASWMYRAALQSILGFHLTAGKLRIVPLNHAEWKYYKLTYHYGKQTRYLIEVFNPKGLKSSITKVQLDGLPIAGDSIEFNLMDDNCDHHLKIEFD